MIAIGSQTLEEVIVTATEVQLENQQGLSQTTLTDSWIEDLYVDSFEELSFFVPGLYIQEQSVNSSGYAIRGMTSDNSEASRNPRVSVWLHGHSISRTQGSYIALFDLDYVESFKGPSATSFGTGGQIGGLNIVPKLAELDDYHDIAIEAGSYNELKLNHVSNVQLNDSSAFRVAIFHHQRDGYIENYDGAELNSIDTSSFRTSFHITEGSLSYDLQFSYEANTPTSTSFQSFQYTVDKPYEESALDDGDKLLIDRDILSLFNVLNYAIDDDSDIEVSLMSRHVESEEQFDPDGTSANLMRAFEIAEYDTAELTISYSFDNDSFSSTTGITVFTEDADVEFAAHVNEQLLIRLPVVQQLESLELLLALVTIDTTLFNPDGTPNPYTDIPLTTARYESQLESVDNTLMSLFSDNTVFIDDQHSISFGLRLEYEELKTSVTTPDFDSGGQATLANFNLVLLPGDDGPTSEAEDEFRGVSGRLSYSYSFNNNDSFFLTLAKSRRPDILNFTEASVFEHLQDETVVSLEAGLQYYLNEDHSYVELSIYTYDFKHFATQRSGISALSFVSDDNASASINGLELSWVQFFNDDLLLFANFAWNDAVFDESEIIEGENRFRFAPEFSGSVSLSQSYAIESAELRITYQNRFQSEVFFEDDNSTNDGNNRQGGYNISNLYVDYLFDQITVGLYIKNLTDKEYIVDAGNLGQLFGMPTFVPAIGRHAGFSIAYSF